jgi:Spy/CpxP family protein refolding chaperone
VFALWVAAIVVAVAVSTAANTAHAQAPGEFFERELIAQGPGAPPPPPPGAPGLFAPRPPLRPGLRFPPPEVLDRLDLSDSQREKIDALGDKVRRASIQLDADIRLAELDVEDLISSDDVSTEDLDDAIAHLEEARTALLRTHAKAIVQMRAMLSPQQRAKLKRPVEPKWH